MTAQEQNNHFTAAKTMVWDLPFDLQGCKVIPYFVLISWWTGVDEIRYDNNSDPNTECSIWHSCASQLWGLNFFVKKVIAEMTTALHYYVFINAFFHLYWELLYTLWFCCHLNHRKTFFRCYVFPQTLMIHIIPMSSNFKKLFAELFPNLNFIWSCMRPGEMLRGPMTRLSRLIPVSGSLFAVSCFQRKRGCVICPLRHNGQQDWHNFRFRRDREIPLWLDYNNE